LLLHAEIAAAMADEFIGLLKTAIVEQEIDTLAGGELAFGVLAGTPVGTSTGFGVGVTAAELLKTVR
jgi:hypothetical protein